METTLTIAHSLSSNILNLGENGAITTEILLQEHCHADLCFEKKSPAVDITRKYDKLCIVAFNRKFHCDDVIKMKIERTFIVENCLS